MMPGILVWKRGCSVLKITFRGGGGTLLIVERYQMIDIQRNVKNDKLERSHCMLEAQGAIKISKKNKRVNRKCYKIKQKMFFFGRFGQRR